MARDEKASDSGESNRISRQTTQVASSSRNFYRQPIKTRLNQRHPENPTKNINPPNTRTSPTPTTTTINTYHDTHLTSHSPPIFTMAGWTNSIYNTFIRRNSVFVGVIFGAAFGFEM
ncbi:hypothetical protein AA313_de0206992 [Arthrobotrys entomopaga]|nr:hypothetical protein AA313_de0206992 [Arthrobotrys entomopaga]